MKLINTFVSLLLLAALAACGSNPTALDVNVEPPQAEMEELAENIAAAEQKQYNLYAPGTYEDVTELYQSASRRLNSKPAQAKELVDKGLRLATQLEETGNRVKQALAVIDAARSDALNAGAGDLFGGDLAKLDEQLTDLARIAEQRTEFTGARESQQLVEKYKEIELRSLKLSILGKAENLLNKANDKRLRNFAPKTMDLAEEEYLLGISVLNADRRQTDTAAGHAANVIRHIEHAEALAIRIKQHKDSESTLEDLLLWHESQLADAIEPLKANIPESKGFAATTTAVNAEIKLLKAENQSLITSINEAKSRENNLKLQKEQDLTNLRQDLEQQMLAVQMESDAERRRVDEINQRFQFVQELFDGNEAEVYQQGQNVLIRAHGFTFEPGSSEISEENIPLINKILDAAEGFPAANFEISGHTDSVGDSQTNQSLSEARARAVADFLSGAGLISASKISSVGHGSRNPVAPNNSDEGRAANRRVEVLIINPG